MSRCVFACTCFTAVLLFASIVNGDEEREQLVGSWVVTECTYNGAESAGYIGCIYTFDAEGGYVLTTKKGSRVEGNYKTDDEPEVRHVSFEDLYDRPSRGGAGPRLGIFKITVDPVEARKATICVAGGGRSPRPEEFESSKDSRMFLMTLVERDDMRAP